MLAALIHSDALKQLLRVRLGAKGERDKKQEDCGDSETEIRKQKSENRNPKFEILFPGSGLKAWPLLRIRCSGSLLLKRLLARTHEGAKGRKIVNRGL